MIGKMIVFNVEAIYNQSPQSGTIMDKIPICKWSDRISFIVDAYLVKAVDDIIMIVEPYLIIKIE